MAEKTAALGVCDHCAGPIGADWYTSKGHPRRYCSTDCRNTANSRAGNPVRIRKAKQRVAAGVWVNPLDMETPGARIEHARKAATAGRLAEMTAGTWRNPALTPAARAKLSAPRTIDDPTLHRAHERLNTGEHMADLTPAERDAYRAHRRETEATRRARQTPEQREKRRAQWRAYQKRKQETRT